jgi:hypothetical protein
VVGFSGTYHAILGRPAYETFMAVPNYTYMKLKIPGLSGIHPRYSCKEGRRVEDKLLLEFPCTPTRTRSM